MSIKDSNDAIDWDAGGGSGTWLDIKAGDPEVALEVRAWGVEASKFAKPDGTLREDVVLTVEVGGELLKWRLNAGARQACKQAAVQVGDVLRVTRGDDVPVDGRTTSRWTITKAVP